MTQAVVALRFRLSSNSAHRAALPVCSRSAAGVLKPHGGKREQVDNVNLPKAGNSSTYLLSKLNRDHPDIANDYAEGKFKSVRAAAIHAGIVKQATG